MKRRFEFHAFNSHKFWEIEETGSFATTYKVVTRWGRVGTEGQSQEKIFQSSYNRSVFINDKIAEKLGKGYNEIALPWGGYVAVSTRCQFCGKYVHSEGEKSARVCISCALNQMKDFGGAAKPTSGTIQSGALAKKKKQQDAPVRLISLEDDE